MTCSLIKLLYYIDDIYNEGREYYYKSLVKRYDIVNVPLKVDTKRFPALAETLNSVKNTTKHINPYKLIKHNIGSNLGLATIMRDYQDDKKMSLNGTVLNYSTINTDENIFYRGMKVCVCCWCLFMDGHMIFEYLSWLRIMFCFKQV